MGEEEDNEVPRQRWEGELHVKGNGRRRETASQRSFRKRKGGERGRGSKAKAQAEAGDGRDTEK